MDATVATTQRVKGIADYDAARQILTVVPKNGASKEFSTKDGVQIVSPDGSTHDVPSLQDIDWPPGYDPTNTAKASLRQLEVTQKEGFKPRLILPKNERAEIIKNDLGQTTVKIMRKEQE